jgi:two-component system cell cycle response regulator DivK
MVMAAFIYFEDDPLSRQVMQIMLLHVIKAAHVVIWEDSTDFLPKLLALSYKPDVILMDIHMQPVNGFEVLKGIRTSGAFESVKIVAVTASVMNEEVEHLRQAGFDGVVGKPIDQRTFPDLIDRIMSGEKVWRPT